MSGCCGAESGRLRHLVEAMIAVVLADHLLRQRAVGH